MRFTNCVMRVRAVHAQTGKLISALPAWCVASALALLLMLLVHVVLNPFIPSRGGAAIGCAPHPPHALTMYTDLAYPMRTPDLAIDAIIHVYEKGAFQGIVLCKRQRPPHKTCFPGGYVEYAESVEQAVAREVLEETGIRVNITSADLKLFGVMSDPLRDTRRHTVSVAYEVIVEGQRPVAADDVKSCHVYSALELRQLRPVDFAFDHYKTLKLVIDRHGW